MDLGNPVYIVEYTEIPAQIQAVFYSPKISGVKQTEKSLNMYIIYTYNIYSLFTGFTNTTIKIGHL